MSLQHNGAAGHLDGGRYVMRARWRGETLLAGASISQGEWRGRTAFANPVVGGGLAGAFDMNQTHAQAGVGARIDVGGLRLQPSATLFSGRVERGGYTARGEAFRAAVPETTQRYRGWEDGAEPVSFRLAERDQQGALAAGGGPERKRGPIALSSRSSFNSPRGRVR